MDIICDKSICTGCAACANICPKNAIKMLEDNKGFKYPHIDESICIDCNLCKAKCPAVNTLSSNFPLKLFACKNLNSEIRASSSSGGVFQELANYILDIKHGFVFGAAFDNEFKVKHLGVNNNQDLEKLKKSKYVQSNTDNIYVDLKKAIENNNSILFSGTPCQVEAVKNFIPSTNDNVFLLDLICHGVPSPKVFEDYKSLLEKRYKSKIININFRFKNETTTQNISVDFENGKNYTSSLCDGDLFYTLFLKDIILRESCYNCKYKQVPRISDITIADFWGIEKGSAKKLNDNKGVTLVLINTEKGLKLFENIKHKFEYLEVSLEDCVNYNCFSNFKKPETSATFWEDYLINGLKEV